MHLTLDAEGGTGSLESFGGPGELNSEELGPRWLSGLGVYETGQLAWQMSVVQDACDAGPLASQWF